MLLSSAAAQQDSVRSGPTTFRCCDVSMNEQVIKAIAEESVTICILCAAGK